MAKTTTYSTLKEFARRVNNDRYDAKSDNFITEAIEEAIKTVGAEKWTFLIKRTRITTVLELSSKGRVNIAANGAKVIFTSGVGSLTQAGVNNTWSAKFNGEDVDYDFASTASGSTISLTSPYVGETDITLTSGAYRLFKRSYDLPADFRELVQIGDVRRPHIKLKRVNLPDMLAMNLQRANGETPYDYSIENKTGDAVRQLWLYPYPSGNTRFQYDLVYYRWPAKPVADADIIDWPDDLIPLLRVAIEMEIARKNEDDATYQLKLADYTEKVKNYTGADIEDGGQWYIGMESGWQGDRRWPLHLNVTQGS